jgi:hypothetical protein
LIPSPPLRVSSTHPYIVLAIPLREDSRNNNMTTTNSFSTSDHARREGNDLYKAGKLKEGTLKSWKYSL